MQVYWTDTAKETYLYVLEYLDEFWGQKHVYKFIENTEKVLLLICRYPELYEPVDGYANLRKAILHKNCSFLYRITDNAIEVLVFWDNRQEPFI